MVRKDVFFLVFDMYFIQHCFICSLSDSIISEDAGIEPRTVATSEMAARRSNHLMVGLTKKFVYECVNCTAHIHSFSNKLLNFFY